MITILYIDSHVNNSKLLVEEKEAAAIAKRMDVEVIAGGDITSIGYVSNVDIIYMASTFVNCINP